jgi:uncharacterized protein (TIGR04255 family)
MGGRRGSTELLWRAAPCAVGSYSMAIQTLDAVASELASATCISGGLPRGAKELLPCAGAQARVSSELSSVRRAQMGQKMKHAPVYFTIVQVRFNPIMALDDYAPKIQDRMRLAGFPDLQRGMLATFNLNIASGEASPAQVPVAQTARYTFSNRTKTAGFMLDQGSLSYQTTEYDVFHTFSGAFVDGLSIVHDVVSLDYVDRIGVRYLDAVYPRENEDISEYLTDSVLGLYGKLQGGVEHSFSETFIRFEKVNVIARTVIQDGPVGFPPDLQPMWLVVGDRFRTLDGLHATLDTDGWQDARMAFNLDDVRACLKLVHSAVTTSFTATVTRHAVESWK